LGLFGSRTQGGFVVEARGTVERKALSKRGTIIVAVVVVGALVVSGVTFVWYEYLRHWTIEDIAESVTGTEENPSFKSSLANRTVTVEGTVTGIESFDTSLGTVHLIELDYLIGPRLVYWDEIDFQVGDEIESEVSFEWSTFNNNTMVLSPQLDFPVLFPVIGMETVISSVGVHSDIYWTYSMEADVLTVHLEWVRDELPLSELNCSLRAGRSFWAAEYVETMKPENYGDELEALNTLTSAVGSAGPIRYIDADVDGNFSTGDSIVLAGLDAPETDSGVQCYMFVLGVRSSMVAYEMYLCMYMPIMRPGVLHVEDSYSSIYTDFEVQDESDGFTLTVCFSLDGTDWSNVSFLLVSDSNCSDYETPPSVWIDPFVGESATGSETVWFSGQVTLGDLVWELIVTDIDGDGIVSLGDRISLVSDSDDVDSALEYLHLELTYEPTDSSVQDFDLIEA